MIQGASIPFAAKWLGVDVPVVKKPIYPIEFTPVSECKSELKEFTIPSGSIADGKTIVELYLPQEFLIILIARENEFIMPSGGIRLPAGNTLIVLADEEIFASVERQLNSKSQINRSIACTHSESGGNSSHVTF